MKKKMLYFTSQLNQHAPMTAEDIIDLRAVGSTLGEVQLATVGKRDPVYLEITVSLTVATR